MCVTSDRPNQIDPKKKKYGVDLRRLISVRETSLMEVQYYIGGIDGNVDQLGIGPNNG